MALRMPVSGTTSSTSPLAAGTAGAIGAGEAAVVGLPNTSSLGLKSSPKPGCSHGSSFRLNRRPRLRLLLDVRQNILLGDATTLARAADLRHIDVMFRRDARHHRRDARARSVAAPLNLRCRSRGPRLQSRSLSTASSGRADEGNQRARLHHVAFVEVQLQQRAFACRRHFRRDLVRFNFQDRFIQRHRDRRSASTSG